MPSKFADEIDLPDEVDQAPVVDQAPDSTAPSEDTGGSSPEPDAPPAPAPDVPKVSVRVTKEYAADAPWSFGFNGEGTDELEIGTDPVSVDARLASQLLENPMIELAD